MQKFLAGLDRFSVIFSKKLTFLQHVEAKFILRNFYENLVGGEDRLQIVVWYCIVFMVKLKDLEKK